MRARKALLFATLIGSMFLVVLGNLFCRDAHNTRDSTTAEGGSDGVSSVYLNHNDTVKYVGIETCRSCHTAIYNTFIQTGMGQSFDRASRSKSAADFSRHHVVYDRFSDMYYHPYLRHDSMYIMEYRMSGRDTVHKRVEKADFVVGSGQHTNSHMMNVNGYLYQLPLTWYAQRKKWDLPPGYENGHNVRFSRAIGIECMSCHNALPGFEEHSLNKFTTIPSGIDCERCHGPGEIHVKEKLAGKTVDTVHGIDYTIVNPRNLPWELQIDVCQRCHLQGNAVLREGKSFADFRPGKKLSDYIDVFMPRYKGRDDEFIMASHAQRLQMSKCFVKGAGTATHNPLTCISCHNPHVSVKVTGKQVFNQACGRCHDIKTGCTEKYEVRMRKNDNCVECHMPKSGTIDIPHVTVTDHWIRVQPKEKEEKKEKIFTGIYSINNPKPDLLTRVKAWLSYYEKFEGELTSLDSASKALDGITGQQRTAADIHHLYLKSNNEAIAARASAMDAGSVNDPWTCYRIGQAHQSLGQAAKAEKWYRRAVDLAPGNLDFRNKLGAVMILQDRFEEGLGVLQASLERNPKQSVALTDMGFAFLQMHKPDRAMQCYDSALALDPDFEQALLNKAGLFNIRGEKKEAMKMLKRILKRDPRNEQVKELMGTLQ